MITQFMVKIKAYKQVYKDRRVEGDAISVIRELAPQATAASHYKSSSVN